MDKKKVQLLYGAIIIMVGISVIYRVPQVMVRVMEIEYFSNSTGLVKFCFYFLGGLLMIAGIQKIYKNYK